MPDAQATAVICGELNVLRCFSRSGIPTAVLFSDPSSPALFSRDCGRKFRIADCREDMTTAAEDILRFGRTLRGNAVLYYGADEMLLLISRFRERLGRYFRFLLPPMDLIEDLVDKTRFMDLARRLDLPVPRTVSSREVHSLAEAERAVTLPCVLKPARRAGWFESTVFSSVGGEPRKALRADTPEQFRRAYVGIQQYSTDFVMQQYVPGNDACICSFHAYYDGESRPRAWYVGRKIRTYPMDSGVSTYVELVKEPAVVRLGMEVLEKMQFVGPVKVDFKRDADSGRFYLLEINPRFNLWNQLGAACGINIPVLAYHDLLGRPVPAPADYRTGVRWLAFGDDARAFVRDYRRKGGLSWAGWLWSLRGRKVYDLFSWRDPLPWVVSVRNYCRAMLHKRTPGWRKAKVAK